MMRNPLSKKITGIEPSGIRKFFDLVSEMPDAISLGVGEPDFDTPWRIREEGIYTLEQGKTFYTSNAGLKDLKIEISKYLERKIHVEYDPDHEIMVTVGGSEGIDVALRAMLDPGDEVLIPQPSYVSYDPCTILADGVPVSIPLKNENEFKLTKEELEAVITPKTKILVMPFPNNPTGAIMTREELEPIAEVVKEYDLYDQVFRPVEHPEIFRVRPCIWSGIYRREWLLENHVSFAETPGASYQDTGFAFKVWASAERALLVRDAYLHYRTDNANSSVKAAAKIYCICDEFKSIEEFLEKRPELKEELEKPVISLKYISYRWNLFRLTMEFKYAFLERMHKELSEAKNRGLFDKKYFTEKEWTDINRLVDDMDAFFDETFRKELLRFGSEAELAKALKKSENKVTKLQKKIDDMENSSSLKIGRAITFVPRKLKKMLH